MTDQQPMTPEAARAAMLELSAMINCCVDLLRPYRDLIARFEEETKDMQSFGAILNPSLFMSSERRAAEAILAPIFRQAAVLVDTYDRQTAHANAALEKVRS